MTELAIGTPIVLIVYAVAFLSVVNDDKHHGLINIAIVAAFRCYGFAALLCLGLAASFGIGWLVAWGFR
jgi:hypothetical protein